MRLCQGWLFLHSFHVSPALLFPSEEKLSHRPPLFPRSPRWSRRFTAKHFILWSVAISCKLLLGLLMSRSVSAALCNLAYNFTLVESLWDSLRAMITVILWGGFYDGSDGLLRKYYTLDTNTIVSPPPPSHFTSFVPLHPPLHCSPLQHPESEWFNSDPVRVGQ